MPDFHAPWSASATKRWKNCPGSVALSVGIPRKDSVYSLEGTQAHDLCEKKLLGEEFAKSDYDSDMHRCSDLYVEEIRSWENTYELILSEHTERYLSSVEFGEKYGGTSDHCMIAIDTDGRIVAHVIDFKYGIGIPVSAYENEQMLTYGFLVQENHDVNIDLFRFTIIQPRASNDDVDNTWSCGPERIKQHRDEVADAMERDNLKAGDHCRFCPALTICPELKRNALEIAQREFESPKETAHVTDEIKAHWAHVFEISGALKKYIDEIPDAILWSMSKGEEFEGLKAVVKKSNLRWKESDEEIIKKLQRAGIGKKVSTSPKLRTPTQIAKDGHKEVIAKLSHRAETGHKVVHESAKGEAVSFLSSNGFKDLEFEENEDE